VREPFAAPDAGLRTVRTHGGSPFPAENSRAGGEHGSISDGTSVAEGTGMLLFPPFRLDPSDERLWRGNQVITLKPKAFALLRYLAERPQRLITKEELLNHFWSDVFVGDAVLKTHMAEIRRALGDDIKAPRFIATAHRRGYRFIADVGVAAAAPAPSLPAVSPTLRRVPQGQPQATSLTGAPGAGKSTLPACREASEDPWLARGRCIESSGSSDAYLPLLEALAHLCRQPCKEHILEALHASAPSWLTELPRVLDVAERACARETLSAQGAAA
jgi:DNA-binding winged helix-turn-helix (wHTH) protein